MANVVSIAAENDIAAQKGTYSLVHGENITNQRTNATSIDTTSFFIEQVLL